MDLAKQIDSAIAKKIASQTAYDTETARLVMEIAGQVSDKVAGVHGFAGNANEFSLKAAGQLVQSYCEQVREEISSLSKGALAASQVPDDAVALVLQKRGEAVGKTLLGLAFDGIDDYLNSREPVRRGL